MSTSTRDEAQDAHCTNSEAAEKINNSYTNWQDLSNHHSQVQMCWQAVLICTALCNEVSVATSSYIKASNNSHVSYVISDQVHFMSQILYLFY